MTDFLGYVVRQSLAGREDEIKEYTVAVEALGKGAGFDPQQSSSVRTLAGRVRKGLADYYADEGGRDRLVISLPKGRYAPAYETRDIFPASSEAGLPGRQSPSKRPCIAVLPITINDDALPAEAADTVGRRISDALTLFRDLDVVSPIITGNIMRNFGDYEHVREKTKADYLLTGIAGRLDNGVQIQMALSDSLSHRQVWTRTFSNKDAGNTDTELEQEIVEATAGCIGGMTGAAARLWPRSAPSEEDECSVYDAMRAYTEIFQEIPSAGLFNKSAKSLRAALRHEPRNPTLLAMLADTCLSGYGLGVYHDPETPAKVGDLLAQAFLTGADDPFTLFMHGYYHMVVGNFALAEKMLEKSVALNPYDVFCTGLCGHALALLGRFDRGLAILEKGRELNPFFLTYNYFPYYLSKLRSGEYQQALDLADQFHIPGFFWSPLMRAVALALLGRGEEARKDFQSVVELLPDFEERAGFYVGFLVVPDDLRELFRKGLLEAGGMEPDFNRDYSSRPPAGA